MATPHLHKLSKFVNLLKRSTGVTIVLCWGAICIAAVVEDRSVLPPLVDLGKGGCGGYVRWGLGMGSRCAGGYC